MRDDWTCGAGDLVAVRLIAAGPQLLPYGRRQHAQSGSSCLCRAGGAIDSLARILADEIARTSGQTIIIDSRPGGGGVIAAEAVARAAPDGNTLLINTNGMIVNALLRKVSFDPLTSFEPICKLVTSPLVLVVNSASPYRTLNELVAGGAREARGAVVRERRPP